MVSANEIITIGEHSAKASTWRRAIERARSEGVKVYYRDGEWLASSVSEPGTLHKVNGFCTCRAGERGLVCKHLAATVAARYKRGELHRCELCGRVAEDVVEQGGHVGGHSEPVYRWHCSDRVACWHRWDEQNGLAN